MAENVVVAVDGGAASDAAVDWVAARSRGHRVDVDLTTVVEPHVIQHAGDHSHDEALSRAGDLLAAHGAGMHVVKYVRHGELVHSLIGLTRGADLLVIGARDGASLATYVHGRVAHGLARHAECVVVVVPAGWRPCGHGVVAAWKDDETAQNVLTYAANEADRSSEPLRILHVWDIPPAIDGPGAATMVDEDIEIYRQLLASTTDRLRAEHPELEIDGEIGPGAVPFTVMEAAADAQLLVIGAPLHGALAGFLLGSVSSAVLRELPCPVAIIPRTVPLPVTAPVKTKDEVRS